MHYRTDVRTSCLTACVLYHSQYSVYVGSELYNNAKNLAHTLANTPENYRLMLVTAAMQDNSS